DRKFPFPFLTRFVSPPLTAGLFVNPEGSYPKPSISVSPAGVIPVGGNVTIRCRHLHLDMRFLLYKAGVGNYLNYTDPAGSEAEFPITSARREQSGNYTCPPWAAPSPRVRVPGREFLKPTIWVSPSRVVALGGSVTIRCEGRYRSMKFFLRKAGHPNPPVQTVPDGTVAEFPIPSVGREDGGSYTCEYHPIAEQNRSSHPSDPVEIIVGGEGLGSPSRLPPSYPKPNISLSPSGEVSLGGAVAVWCHGQHRGVRFVLNKERRHFTHVDPVGSEASFSIRNVSREDGGSYSCSYHSRSEPVAVSYPSDPVELVVRGEGPGSVSPFPAPPPARPSRGSVPMGRSEPGSALSPDPAEGTPGRGAGTESLGGSPAGGSSSSWRFGAGVGGRISAGGGGEWNPPLNQPWKQVVVPRDWGWLWGTGAVTLGEWGPDIRVSSSPRPSLITRPPAPPMPPALQVAAWNLLGDAGEGQDLGGWAVKLDPAGCESPGAITPPPPFWAT
uniref:Ig-like domain-containing protein n=1 Tax=Chelydra serpentina TaxID=8475 RepID=A0A8C3RXP0_CHESE